MGRDPWAAEFLAALAEEHARRSSMTGRRGADVWYALQVAAPTTTRFARLMRRRRRQREREGAMGGTTGVMLEGLANDLRHGARGLSREWRMALFVILTLALGIGANAATVGVADRILLRGPAHVIDPGSLERLYLAIDDDGDEARRTPWIPWATGEALRRDLSDAAVALYRAEDHLVEGPGGVRPAAVSVVGDGWFELLGVTPRLGSLFGGSDDAATGGVAVLSWDAWRLWFGGRSDALGGTVRVGGTPYTVVGVAPQGFTGPHLAPVDLWIPLDPADAGSRNWNLVARLAPGPRAPRLERLVSQADAIHARTDPGRFFQWAREGRFATAPLAHDDAGDPPAEAAVARLLIAVAVLILVIGIANVASLLLARLTRRRREMAVRLALGGGRGRLARLVGAEALILAALAGLASLPMAHLAGGTLRRLLTPGVPWPEPPLSAATLGATLAATFAVALLVSLVPLRAAASADVADGLRGGRDGDGRGRARLHLALATAQVGLSAALLLGAGLFLKSFWTMRVTDLGVDARDVTAFRFRAADPGLLRSPSEREYELYLRAADVARAHPGVASAALTLGLPFLYNFGVSVHVPGRDSVPELPGGGPYLSAVGPDYFETVGTTVVRGRSFTALEHAEGSGVVIVSEAMASTLWPDGSAVGSCLVVGGPDDPCRTVVGVVENVHRVGYREPPSMQYYLPLDVPRGFGGMALVVRPRGGAAVALDELRAQLAGLDPEVAFVEAAPLDAALDAQIRPWRTGSWILGMAAALALVVSLLGVYGVLSYLVERRRREMGVRLALGASRGGVRRLVLARGLYAAAAGTALGVGATIAAGRWLAPLLFETSVADPLVMAAVSGLLVGTSALACLVPAERAARVEPRLCLREE